MRINGVMSDCTIDWTEIRQVSGPCIRPGGPVLTERALEVCMLSPGSCIVDIGCGAGGTLKRLERSGAYGLTGLDLSEPLLAEAASHLASVSLIQGRAEALPFRQDSFHALFCECVLSILNDRITAINEFARVLKETGFLIISDIFEQACSGQGAPVIKPEQSLGRNLLNKEEIIGRLTRLQFSILLWEEHQRFLQEFAARFILAGERLPDQWCCGLPRKGNSERPGISYFLLVAKKNKAAVSDQLSAK